MRGSSFLSAAIYIVQLDKSSSLERWGLQPLEPPPLSDTTAYQEELCGRELETGSASGKHLSQVIFCILLFTKTSRELIIMSYTK